MVEHEVMIGDGPEHRPDGIADRIDTVSVMPAKVDVKGIFADQSVGFGDKGILEVLVIV